MAVPHAPLDIKGNAFKLNMFKNMCALVMK
jgi:hypothetical protein